MTSISWFVALTLGSLGGALNAALSDRARVLPSLVSLSPGGMKLVRIGISGNVVTAAAATLAVHWAFDAAGASLGANSWFGLVLLACCDLFIGFVSARGVTNEVDKRVLRRAVFKAASAPAAHPDTVGAMEMAPPETLYSLVDGLMPRRAGHR
jgi:hypothetical protein